MEEDKKHVNSNSNNEIIYVTAQLNGVQSTIMIDTGSVSYTHLDVYKRQVTPLLIYISVTITFLKLLPLLNSFVKLLFKTNCCLNKLLFYLFSVVI